MTSSPISGLPVPPGLERSAYRDRQEWVASGAFAVDLLTRTAGRSDLGGIDLLDVGCGTKVVKTLIDRDLPIGRYVGIDVEPKVIAWLRAQVTDPRFEFRHLPARNDLYNPNGIPLDQFAELPVDGRRFDLICLFSVFTHLDPGDYVTMLRLLRPCVKAEGQLLFSLFMNDPDHPSPWVAGIEASLASDDPNVVSEARAALERLVAAKDRGFVDEIPDKPLLQARYDKAFALELIEGTGWEVASVHPPERYIQHYLICRPVGSD